MIIITDLLGKAAVMDSLLLRSFSLSALAVDGPLVVEDCLLIQGKLPKAMSTKDSRRPGGARDLGLLFELIPPINLDKKSVEIIELLNDRLIIQLDLLSSIYLETLQMKRLFGSCLWFPIINRWSELKKIVFFHCPGRCQPFRVVKFLLRFCRIE